MFCPECGSNNKPKAKYCIQCGITLNPETISGKLRSKAHGSDSDKEIILDNRYKILGIIEKGGMGAVYRALDTRLNIVCAVKEMRENFEKEEYRVYAIEKFKSEALILSKLRHPNIPRVSDYFIEHNHYYIVMDYVEGETLYRKAYRRPQKRLEEKELINWVVQLCDVFTYLHHQDPPIIYRDMKPSNVMVTKDDRVMLIDFGIARIFNPQSRGTMIGTQGYSPPEQYRGKVEPRSDIYALGATLHHLVTGKDPQLDAPFSFQAVGKLRGDLSPKFIHLIDKCLEFKPENRFSSAEEIKNYLISGFDLKETKDEAVKKQVVDSKLSQYSKELEDLLLIAEEEEEKQKSKSLQDTGEKAAPQKEKQEIKPVSRPEELVSKDKKKSTSLPEVKPPKASSEKVSDDKIDKPEAAENIPANADLVPAKEEDIPLASGPKEESKAEPVAKGKKDEPEFMPLTKAPFTKALGMKESEPSPVKPIQRLQSLKKKELSSLKPVISKEKRNEVLAKQAEEKAEKRSDENIVQPVKSDKTNSEVAASSSEKKEPVKEDLSIEERSEKLTGSRYDSKQGTVPPQPATERIDKQRGLMGEKKRGGSDLIEFINKMDKPAMTAARPTVPFGPMGIKDNILSSMEQKKEGKDSSGISLSSVFSQKPKPRIEETESSESEWERRFGGGDGIYSSKNVADRKKQKIFDVSLMSFAGKTEGVFSSQSTTQSGGVPGISDRKQEESSSVIPYKNWYMYRGDALHTANNYDAKPCGGNLKWRFRTSGRIYSSPCQGPDGIIYIGSNDGCLYAVDSDGKEKWRFSTDSAIYTSPLVNNYGIYFGSEDNKFYAVDFSGREKWHVSLGNAIYSSPVAGSDGTIYFGCNDGNLYAVDSFGIEKWHYNIDNFIYSSPTVTSEGLIYVGAWDKCLHALDCKGRALWKFKTMGIIDASPAVDSNNTAYFGSYDGYIYAVDIRGKMDWKVKTGDKVYSSAAIDSKNNGIVVGSCDGLVYSITSGGRVRWRFKTDYWVKASPIIDGKGNVYIGSDDFFFYGINSDGELLWKFKTNGSLETSGCLSRDGVLYFGSNDGWLYALG